MTDLVLCLGAGKGTWAEAYKLIQSESWNKVFLVTNSFGKEKFQAPNNAEFVLIDDRLSAKEILAQVKGGLDGKISGIEVAVNFISGGGKEHMALISAVLQLGFAMRLVVLTEKGMEEL
jgi:hypothetical protein